jgi:hypothetical protein
MNWRLVSASLLAGFTFVIHFIWGGRDVADPLLGSTLAGELKQTLYAVWHMASWVLLVSAIALFLASLPKHQRSYRPVVVFISILWLLFAITFLAIAMIQPGSGWFLRLPQWILLAPVGALGLWGAMKPFVSAKSEARA